MRTKLIRAFAAALAAFCLSACSPAATKFELASDMKGERILFFGAHPDDEWGLAPIFAEACIEKGATCHFVVASDAKSWGCFLVGGERNLDKCSEIRRGEMKKSAALFGAEAEFYGWEEKFYSHNAAGFERNMREWEDAYGGREGLVQRIAETLVAFHPTQVFALDPRHGSTCHPNHRVVARLVVDAVKSLPANERPDLWFEQSDNIRSRSEEVARINEVFGYIGWPDTVADTRYFDGTHRLPNGRRAYDYGIDVLRQHISQAPDVAAGKTATAEDPALMQIPVARYSGDADADFCEPLGLRYPTFDTPEGRAKFGLDEE